MKLYFFKCTLNILRYHNNYWEKANSIQLPLKFPSTQPFHKISATMASISIKSNIEIKV